MRSPVLDETEIEGFLIRILLAETVYNGLYALLDLI